MEFNPLKVLKSDGDYDAALAEVEELWNSPPGSPEADRLELLSLLVEAYEEAHHPIGLPDPVEAIRFRMDQLGMSRADLGRVLGSRSRATEVLNRDRPLSLAMIRSLSRELAIPAEVLIQEPVRRGAASHVTTA